MVKSDSKDGSASCPKRFPKFIVDETMILETANHVTYKKSNIERRGEYAIMKCPYQRTYVEETADNGLVMPYNTMLLRRFQCHLNVELCISGGWRNQPFVQVCI